MKALFFSALFIPAMVFAAPDWAEKPDFPANSYSGIGIGENINAAKQDALRQIANSVTATVTSAVSQTIQTTNNKGRSSSKSYAQVVSDSVILPDIEWKNIEEDDGIYYAAGSVSKPDLISLYEQHLEAKYKEFEYLNGSRELALSEYLTLFESQDELETMAIQAATVSDESPASREKYSEIIALLDKHNAFKGSLCFDVKTGRGSGYEKKVLQPAIEEAVHLSDLKVGTGSSCTPIYFNSSSSTVKENGKRYENIVMQIDIGKPVVANKLFRFSGESSGSKKQALVDAASKFSSYFSDKRSMFSVMLRPEPKSISIE